MLTQPNAFKLNASNTGTKYGNTVKHLPSPLKFRSCHKRDETNIQ